MRAWQKNFSVIDNECMSLHGLFPAPGKASRGDLFAPALHVGSLVLQLKDDEKHSRQRDRPRASRNGMEYQRVLSTK